MNKKVKEKIEELRKIIKRHNRLYYTENRPLIADGRYDELLKELRELEEKYPEFKSPDSPVLKIGASTKRDFKKIKHVEKMLSLQALQKEKEAIAFDKRSREALNLERIAYICEPKLDGLSVELRYENSIFTEGATRGNGIEGEDITENIKTIKSIPKSLRVKNIGHLVVRGEVIMFINDFQKLNKRYTKENKQAFANPRNAAAGSLRQLDSKVTAERKLETFIYEIMEISGREIKTQKEALDFLKNCGFKVNSEIKRCQGIKEAIAYHDEMEKKRDTLDYEIDGVVIKLDNLSYHKVLGKRTTSPRWAAAYKFEPRKEVTIIDEIIIQVGRTGILTPVALLRPVEVGGVTVSRATLHNMDEIRRKDIRKKDEVRVQRAGDVIPQVVSVNKKARASGAKEFHMLKKCPSCNSPVIHEDVYYFCTGGISCPAQIKESIKHFASKEAMDIEGFSDKTIESFFEKGIIKNIPDIYKIRREEIIKLPGWKEKSTQNLIDSIERSKNTTLSRFIYALGIRHVGRHLADLLADNFSTLDELKEAKTEPLKEINEIGPKVAESILSFFHNKNNLKIIEELVKNGIKIKKIKREGKLEGLTFIFTGSLSSLSRAEAKKEVEANGGRLALNLSGEVDYLVRGKDPGSKFKKAQKLNKIEIISEKKFMKLLED